MTFTFKLAARLARLWSAMVLLFAAFAIGCVPESGSANDPTPTDSTIVAITIDPNVILIDTADAVVFEALGQLAAGGSTPVSVTWSASGGTITPAGVFHADAAGLYDIVAQYDGGNLVDSARVYVSAPPPPTLASIVTPASASADTGASVTFAAYGRNTDGDSVAVTVSWTVPGSTMSQNGVFQAATAGDYLVIARANGNKADTAFVTVTASAPPPAGLASVVVTPSSVTVQAGVSAAFSAYGVNTAGDSIAVTAAWSASGGTVSPSGLFQAAAAGSYSIVAQSGGKADTAHATDPPRTGWSTSATPQARAGSSVTTSTRTGSAAISNTLTGTAVLCGRTGSAMAVRLR